MDVLGALPWYIRTRTKLFLGKGVQKSYAQFGEDIVAAAILRVVTHGTYVDVGAFDPVLYSNTYHFYKKGWRGLVIDPNPSAQAKFALMRPRDTFVPVGIAETEGTLPYWKFNYSAYNTFDAQGKENYLKENSLLRVIGVIEARTIPLATVLKEHSITAIDFLSIDAQGFDLQVLRSMRDIRPTLIAVETMCAIEALPNSDLYLLLAKRGYKLVGIAGLTLLFILKRWG